MFLLVLPSAGSGQPIGVLHITIVVTNSDRKPTPVPHHALLISDNPATSTPRRVVTTADGTVDVRLRPGNYTVESDEPLAFEGRGYQWRQDVDIVVGRDVVLAFTTGNAEIGPAPTAASTVSFGAAASNVSSLLMRWQDSVVALWTPTAHASGFVIDAQGLIATNQRVIGGAASVEVQVTPTVKVAGRVLAADADRDVAVVWVDPTVTAMLPSVSLGCAPQSTAIGPVKEKADIMAIGAPLRQETGPAFGTVTHADAHAIGADLRLPPGSTGGPVFTDDGTLVGLTSIGRDHEGARAAADQVDTPIVPAASVCPVVASAERAMKGSAPPSAARLPMEPVGTFAEDALEAAAKRRVGSLNPYVLSSSDFDVAFITPVEIAGAENRAVTNPFIDFGNWSEYVDDTAPVLLIRVTPKQVESLLTKVARGAASTQGAALPRMPHAKAGFGRLRLFCGDAEVTPIHAFTIQPRTSDTAAIDGALYVVDPDALGPQCAAVKLALSSDKAPEKADTRVVDPAALSRIRQDFTFPRVRQ